MNRAALALVLLQSSWMACGRPAHTGLLPGFESHVGVDAARRLVVDENHSWDVVEESLGRGSALKCVRVRVSPFTDLAVRGELELHFFNDQLESTWFFPSNPTLYRARLASERRLRFDAANELHLPPNTLVWIAEDHRGRAYVAWEDKWLAAQRRRATS